MSKNTLLLLGLLSLLGCSRSNEPTNILLVTLDTTRADRLGCYGHAQARTPTLDALAAEGWRFEDVTSPYPLTLPAHVSMMTGRYPFEHGSRNNGMMPRQDISTVAERLRGAGYRTAAVVSAMVLGEGAGLARGFERYDDELGPQAVERTADATTDAALRALDSLGSDPFFLWVHYFDAHHPYQPPAGFAVDDPYDGEIAFVDAQLRRLLEGLGERRGRTAIVVTADHGEAFGEHGEQQHGLLVYETTIRVPLIVRVPGQAARVVSHAASLIDVAPTLLDLAGVDAPSNKYAISLLDLARGKSRGRAIVAESILPFYNHGAEPLAAIKQDNWKYVHAPRPELYDLRQDPSESTDLHTSRGEKGQRLRETLAAIHPLEWSSGAMPDEGDAIDAKTRQMLASLGYVADDHRVQTRADPKDLVRALDLVREGDRHAARGQAQAAEAAYRQALRLLPNDWKATWRLGDFLVERDRLEEARKLYEMAKEADPQNLSLAVRLGRVLRLMGRTGAALEELGVVLHVMPDHRTARIERSLALEELGRHAEARRELERLLQQQEDPTLRAILEQMSR